MNQHATVRVHGNAGVGLAENMMSGRVVVDGDASQAAGATARGGLLVVHGNASARCAHLAQGRRRRRARLDRPHGRVHGAARPARRLRRRRRRARRLALRGASCSCAARSTSLGADCVEKDLRAEHVARAAASCSPPAGIDDADASAVPPLRLGPHALQLQRRRRRGLRMSAPLDPHARDGPARVGDVRPPRDPRDPARRAHRHLRHPRRRGEAARAALRRPAAARRVRLALPAGGLPRALRHRRHARHALREESRSSWRSRSRSPACRSARCRRTRRRRSAAARPRWAPPRRPATAA